MTTPKKHLSRAQPIRPHPMLNLKVPKTWLATLSPSTPMRLTQQIPASLKPIPDDMGEVAKSDAEARDCESATETDSGCDSDYDDLRPMPRIPKTWLATLSPPTRLTQQIHASLRPKLDDMEEVAKRNVEVRDCESAAETDSGCDSDYDDPHPMPKIPKTWLTTLSPPTHLTQQTPASLKPNLDEVEEVAESDVETRYCESGTETDSGCNHDYDDPRPLPKILKTWLATLSPSKRLTQQRPVSLNPKHQPGDIKATPTSFIGASPQVSGHFPTLLPKVYRGNGYAPQTRQFWTLRWKSSDPAGTSDCPITKVDTRRH